MIVRPTRPTAETPTAAAPRLAQQDTGFAAEGAPPTGSECASTPFNAALRHGPAPRKRWLREHQR